MASSMEDNDDVHQGLQDAAIEALGPLAQIRAQKPVHGPVKPPRKLLRGNRSVYQPAANILSQYKPGDVVKVYIDAKFFGHQFDPACKVWGSDIYTQDSDILAAAHHTGFCTMTQKPLPPLPLQERITTGAVAQITMLPPRPRYVGTARCGLRSKSWPSSTGTASFRVDNVRIVQRDNYGTGQRVFATGRILDMEFERAYGSYPSVPGISPSSLSTPPSHSSSGSSSSSHLHFRALSANPIPWASLCFDRSNDIAVKYSLEVVEDPGYTADQFTASRLASHCLYIDSLSERYELRCIGETTITAPSPTRPSSPAKMSSKQAEEEKQLIYKYRWSRVLEPWQYDLGSLASSSPVPLPSNAVEIIADNLSFEELVFASSFIAVRGKEFSAVCARFFTRSDLPVQDR